MKLRRRKRMQDGLTMHKRWGFFKKLNKRRRKIIAAWNVRSRWPRVPGRGHIGPQSR